MANYYWVGATASAGISRYDFNTPANWQTSFWNSQSTGASSGWVFQVATNSPGIGDIAFVGTSDVGVVPLANSPLLYGGYSGNVEYGEWNSAAGSTGTTLNSSLSSITIDAKSKKYPFNYFGGGLTGAIYNWAVGTDGLTTSAFIGSTGARATQPMKLKVRQNYIISSKSTSIVDIFNVKSINISPGTTAALVATKILIAGEGTVRVQGGSIAEIQNNGTGILYLSGLTCGELRTIPTSVFVETNTRFSNVYIQEGTYKDPMWFGGSLDTQSVLADLGFVGSTTGNNAGANDSGFIVSPIANWWNGGGLTTNPVVYFGMPGLTSNLSYCKKISIVSSLGGTAASSGASKWHLAFAGGVSAASVEVDDATVRGYEYLNPTVTVSIGQLGLSRYSVLDLAHEGSFDNWVFGSITGSQVNGGVIFRDETPIIRGSAGVRLFNSQIVLGNRFDARTGKIANTSSSLPEAV